MPRWALAAALGLGLVLLLTRQATTGTTDATDATDTAPADPPPDDSDTAPTMSDQLDAVAATVGNFFAPSPAAGMSTSAAGLAHLQSFEDLRLTPYRLGDGGSTLGWGRYFPDTGPAPPARIDRATADAWFAADVVEKGERWVKAYVDVPVTQPQFDALVSMAFNLKPASFKTIAAAVNAGEDPEAAALQFVRPGSNLERGLRRRRAAELALYRADPTTYG